MMYMYEKRKNPRNTELLLDLLHIVIGILVVVLAVLAFLNPDANQFLFPFIFFLAALLNGVNGWFKLIDSGRNKRKKISSILLCTIAGGLFLLGILSASSIWR